MYRVPHMDSIFGVLSIIDLFWSSYWITTIQRHEFLSSILSQPMSFFASNTWRHLSQAAALRATHAPSHQSSCICMLLSVDKFDLWTPGCQDWCEFQLDCADTVFNGVFCNGYIRLNTFQHFYFFWSIRYNKMKRDFL